ncbi:hypothetical protein FS842_011295 [Serendipita sp. 407]|nr:hypothetical protein FS842_011295 [Serendipita sp. 407]
MSKEWPVGIKVGVCILAIAGLLSFIPTVFLIGFIAISASKSRSEDHSFSRSHLAAYFVCLLFCDAVEGVSSILNIGSVSKGVITEDTMCVVQGALKQFGHVGTALWLLVIAIQTFCLLFYRAHPPRWVFFSTLSGIWLLILIIMLIGPVMLRPTHGAPFWGAAGMWCWIRKEYSVEKYALHYAWQWFSALVSLILYTLLFFRLRGNIQVDDRWRFHFQRRSTLTANPATNVSLPNSPGFSSSPRFPTSPGYSSSPRFPISPGFPRRLSTSSQHMAPMVDPKIQRIARNMMLYPIAYIFLLLPHSIVRFLGFAGGVTTPSGVSLVTATLLMLNGLVDSILFTLTRPSATAGRSFLPHSLRAFFGLLSEDGSRGNARKVPSYHSSAQEVSTPPMEQACGISIEVNVERKAENWPGSQVTYSHGWERPVGLHGTIASLTPHHHHHRRDSSSLTVCTNFDRRKISFEDERKAEEQALRVKTEDEEFIQYLQPQPPSPVAVAEAPVPIQPVGFGRAGRQVYSYDGSSLVTRPIISHPYNSQTMR